MDKKKRLEKAADDLEYAIRWFAHVHCAAVEGHEYEQSYDKWRSIIDGWRWSHAYPLPDREREKLIRFLMRALTVWNMWDPKRWQHLTKASICYLVDRWFMRKENE